MSLRRQSKISFIIVIALLPVCIVAIFAGIAMTGGGHGTYGPFFASLALAVATGLLLLYSVVTGLIAAQRDIRAAPWLLAAIPLLLFAAALGLWGLQG